MPKARKPGDCICPCHQSGMTGALGPCGWCADLHRPKVPRNDGSDDA